MDVKTYRAGTMQEALALVRRELGPQAAVLHTREVRGGGLLNWFNNARVIEVMASATATVPSRLPSRLRATESTAPRATRGPSNSPSPRVQSSRPTPGPELWQDQMHRLQSSVDNLCGRSTNPSHAPRPEELFELFTDLIEADVHDELAREYVDRIARESQDVSRSSGGGLKDRLAKLIEVEIPVVGPIQLKGSRRHLVALVGPTGVGKTTTIAKLAANFRLREKRRVGLVTVDTYRIAAVEQLRTYADIIDLPMEIVATPREMHQALARMAELDLILLDTAGRSPRDDAQIQELKSILTEAAPHEVHLVLSSVTSAASLTKTAAQFARVGASALVLTKLDEAASLGNLLPLIRGSRLPLSYLTHGQNVPDDIMPADAGRLARAVLGIETIAG